MDFPFYFFSGFTEIKQAYGTEHVEGGQLHGSTYIYCEMMSMISLANLSPHRHTQQKKGKKFFFFNNENFWDLLV